MPVTNLVETWIPASMIAVLFFFIFLDSMWLAYRDRKRAERMGGAAAGGGSPSAEERWHAHNRALLNEKSWHEENRRILANRAGSKSRKPQSVGAAAAPADRLDANYRGSFWGPWLVLTSLIIGAGIVFWLMSGTVLNTQ